MTLLRFNSSQLPDGRTDVALVRDGKKMVFNCSAQQLEQGMRSYDAGALVQRAFSFLNNAEREFLMTGMTQKEWDAMAREVEDDEDPLPVESVKGIEASDMGWRPGQWPESFVHEGTCFRRKGLIVSSSGGVMGIAYADVTGVVLNVFND